MTRPALPLIALALAVAVLAPGTTHAQEVRGSCKDGALWWATPQAAGLGPCESPEEGFFRIVCEAEGPVLRVSSPYPIAIDQRGTVDLTVDGRQWRIEGRGTHEARTDTTALHGAALPAEARAALAAGLDARLDMPTETRRFHLTGSGAALSTLTC